MLRDKFPFSLILISLIEQNKIQINCEKIFYVYKDTGKIIFQTIEI